MFTLKNFKPLLTLFLSWLLMGMATAQSNFLYIQSENNSPYYIQLNGINYSSNTKGYLLIPQMQNGEYSIIVGFAGDQYSEYTYSFSIENKPKGYSLKLTQEGEWVLMDMVSLELIRGISSNFTPSKQSGKQIQKLSTQQTNLGIDQVYSVKNGSKIDTIVLFIPYPNKSAIRKKVTKQ